MLKFDKLMGRYRRLIFDYMWRSLQVFGKQGVTFLIFILCAKLLDPHSFGIYNYILAIIFLLIVFSDFGVSAATSKYVAEYNATDKEKLKLVVFNSSLIIVGLAAILSMLTLIIGPLYLKEKYIYALFLLPMLFIVPMTSLYDGVYRGLRKFKLLSLISLSVGLISFVIVYYLIKMYGLVGALISQNIFYLLLFLALAMGHREYRLKLSNEVIKDIGKYSLMIALSTIVFFLYTRVDIIVLGHFGYVEEIGYYEIINKLFLLLVLPFNLLAQVVAPEVASLNAMKRLDRIKQKYQRYLIFMAITVTIYTLIIYFIFPATIKLFLKAYFNEVMILSFTILIFLLPFKLWGAFQTQAFIISTGHAKITVLVYTVGGILNVFFDVIFIKMVGFIGVFWVTVIVHSLSILLVTIMYSTVNRFIWVKG
jgi:O-antigen/teichoic acid export membrane protein